MPYQLLLVSTAMLLMMEKTFNMLLMLKKTKAMLACWMCQSRCMDVKLIHGFLQVEIWNCQNWYTGFSTLLHGCQSCYMDLSKVFYPFPTFAKQNQSEVWPRFLTLLSHSFVPRCLMRHINKCQWGTLPNALGRLRLCQCFYKCR